MPLLDNLTFIITTTLLLFRLAHVIKQSVDVPFLLHMNHVIDFIIVNVHEQKYNSKF